MRHEHPSYQTEAPALLALCASILLSVAVQPLGAQEPEDSDCWECHGEDDEMVAKCIEIIRETGRGSTSSLQRRLRIGYTRAARMMDILEERGIVGPPRGSDPREILIDLDAEMPDSPSDDSDSASDSGLEGGDFEHLANAEQNDTPE